MDLVISNCVVNLSPEKPRVFAEALRVLKPGGRLAISDVVAIRPIPQEMRNDPDLLAGCVAGAEEVPRIEALLREAGFREIRIDLPDRDPYAETVARADPSETVGSLVSSAMIRARKPVEPLHRP